MHRQCLPSALVFSEGAVRLDFNASCARCRSRMPSTHSVGRSSTRYASLQFAAGAAPCVGSLRCWPKTTSYCGQSLQMASWSPAIHRQVDSPRSTQEAAGGCPDFQRESEGTGESSCQEPSLLVKAKVQAVHEARGVREFWRSKHAVG